MFKELEIVELTHDIKEKKLSEGDRGTVVGIYKDGEAYEVEFIALDGKSSVLLTLALADIRSILNRELYLSHDNTPVYLSTVTISGTTARGLTMENLLRRVRSQNLVIGTEILENKANAKEFYFIRTTI